jgi:uncharacterized Zn-binding protein involved in type VI secretion
MMMEMSPQLPALGAIYGTAATVGSAVAHPIPGVLTATGSLNVFIGGLPAWRGVPALTLQSQIDGFLQAKEASDLIVQASRLAPLPVQLTVQNAQVAIMLPLVVALGGAQADLHECETLLPPVPHGEGIVLQGSQTVFINGCRACRQGDKVFEPIGTPDPIIMGWPTVWIGG